MNKRLRIALLLLLVMALTIPVWLGFRSREPEYQGRKLSSWLKGLEMVSHNHGWEDRLQAEEAVWEMGTNAIPFLIQTLKKSDPPGLETFLGWLQQVFKWDLTSRLTYAQKVRAVQAFRVLGPKAKPWLAELEALVTNSPPEISTMASWAVSNTRCEEGSAILLRAMSNANPKVYLPALAGLSELGWRGRSAVPALVHVLEGTNSRDQVFAALSLGRIATEPEVAVPALITKLKDKEARMSAKAAGALVSYGNAAASAIPTLRELTNSTDKKLLRAVRRALLELEYELQDGAIVRGSVHEKNIALVFTGHEFAEGGETILGELARHRSKASFFLTGEFLSNSNHHHLVRRIIQEEHLLGAHSERHLRYCAGDASRKTLIEWHQFRSDVINHLGELNRRKVEELGDKASVLPILSMEYFLPPYEHCNREIADWARELGPTPINLTPGTLSNADYTGEADPNFVSSQAIFDSIVRREREDPHRLNGFILLLHLGSGPGRADKFHTRFGELLDTLAAKGYQFVRVDELLDPKTEDAK